VRYWGSFWWDRGWDVLVPQLRSYGAGDEGLIPCTYGVYEQFDLYDLIIALGLDRKTLVIQGRAPAPQPPFSWRRTGTWREPEWTGSWRRAFMPTWERTQRPW
ncbi:MAG: hypothetical protein IKX47_00810, partial [Oscillospiraceae bacterium]|nr:hypothetical protein [Oscillospiraceae bacterium]